MLQPHSSPRCSGTRTLRWAALVLPAAVVLTGSFGASAYAATGGNAAAHLAGASSGANLGVGNMVGNGNDKHADDSSTSTAPTTTDSSTATVTATSSDATTAASSTTDSHQVDCTATPNDVRCAPQPLSNADENSGGANGQCTSGPYCSTRDGTASGNGNGNGQAVGEPCAGCVGKADNKNPKGQKPNGSDHNAGYECDRNHGIGRTNPAHTGCKSGTTTGSCPTGTVKASDGTCKTPCQINPNGTGCHHDSTGDCTTNPTAAGCQSESGGCAANPSAAGCDNSGSGTACTPTQANGFCSDVLGEKVTRKPIVQGEKVVKKTPGSLPFTGSNTTALLLAAGVGLATGSGLLVAGRRRRVRA